MGLIVSIYRDQYDSQYNAFHGKQRVTVVNVSGPFEPSADAPAALLSTNAVGDPIIVPTFIDELGDYQPAKRAGMIGPMYGGTIADTSDSRWREAVGGYHGLPIHDRFESSSQYAALSS